MRDFIEASLISAAVCILGVAMTLHMVSFYGFGVFCGIPFVGGFLSSAWYTHKGRSGGAFSLALTTLLFIGVGLLLFEIEGLFCLLMASPLALLIALLGGLLGQYTVRKAAPAALCLLLTPGLTYTEALIKPEPPTFEVQSSIDIAASPEIVWRNVVEFSELPEEREWLFHAGIAYPMRAKITGRGPGAIRECIFSTGPFVEPIEVWDEPRLLRFNVTSNPAPMQELSPYKDFHPRHLEGFLVSKHGQFQLIPLPGGGTRLEGTTWYQHHLQPAGYWRLWSDYIIHRIHMRVLTHIRTLSLDQSH